MSYIEKIFKNMDLQQIRSFLLCGVEDINNNPQSYEEKLKNCSHPIYSRLQDIYPNDDDLDKAVYDLDKALNIYEEVYMELGMKAGARLIYQLLHTDDQVVTEKSEKIK